MALPIENNSFSFYHRPQADYAFTARPVIKVKLAPVGKSLGSVTANEIVQTWKAERMASPNLTKAIILYQALCDGDPTLLLAEFPWIAGLMTPAQESVKDREVPATAPRRVESGRFGAAVIVEAEDEETLQANSCDQVADFLGDFDL